MDCEPVERFTGSALTGARFPSSAALSENAVQALAHRVCNIPADSSAPAVARFQVSPTNARRAHAKRTDSAKRSPGGVVQHQRRRSNLRSTLINDADLRFIKQWRSLTWTDCSEADVREEFVTPLLWLLGYAKETVNDILRHKSFALPPAYLQIGSAHRIQIDYLNKVMLQNFWVLETKHPDAALTDADLQQCYTYALHPSVRAPLLVLTNGRILRVYDVNGEDYEAPLLECKQEAPEAAFDALVETLHAKSVGAALRRRTIDAIQKALIVETDETVVDAFRNDVMQMLDSTRAVVRSNARREKGKAWQEAFEADDESMRTMPWKDLLIGADVVTNLQLRWGHQIGRRVIEAQPRDRQSMADDLAKVWRGRPHAIFRVHALCALVDMLKDDLNVQSVYMPSVRDGIEELVAGALTYYGHNPLANALCMLDNDCIRVAYKMVRIRSMPEVQKFLDAENQRIAAGDAIKSINGVTAQVIALTGVVVEFVFWRRFSRGDEHVARQGSTQLEILEQSLDSQQIPAYPLVESDLTAFESYGRGHDVLFMGTWDVLQLNKDIIAGSDMSQEVKEFAKLTFDEAHARLAVIEQGKV